LNLNYWTFPVPGTDSVVVTPPDSEGLVLFNSTAAWIWQNRDLPNLSSAYADRFGITLAQAEADIRQTLSPGECVSIKINDKVFEIHLESSALSEEVIPRLGDLHSSIISKPDHIFHLRPSAHATLLYLDGRHFGTEHLITAARALLLQELTRLADLSRPITALLHAGAVGTLQASAILAGPSFSGKSTLCAALHQAGMLCFGDDSVCLTPSFEVAGMPFALSLREGSWPLFPRLNSPRFLPSNLNGRSPTVASKVLLFVNYDPEATATTMEPVPIFDALVSINQSGFWVEHTKTAISAFLEWLSRIPIYRLTYSSLTEAVSRVKALLY
jgi:hypothetical protein